METIDDDSSVESQTWIQWFCDREGHEFFCEIDEEYIRDQFNLYGLKPKFTRYQEAIRMILREDPPEEEEFNQEEFLEVYQQAVDLYGLIHARFILTLRGASLMREKYTLGEFGICPRILCERQYVLPIAKIEELNVSRVKVYCPRCQDCYWPRGSSCDLDGTYFGVSFPQSFIQFFPDMFKDFPACKEFSTKLYGFSVFGKKKDLNMNISIIKRRDY
ncbi:unnamed protein product [Moneuplotes crassus]|uniref:Casein kinase II subunit beta n=1 Tax=Euplotes crassus TaxID=5936 RepID=A0AAD1XN92_EUPCR|nr:unnamed protein product [Moneuplotes crassus]